MTLAISSPRLRKPNSSLVQTCEICSRSFARSEHLVRHRRTHTSERPFQCSFCHADFPRSDVRDNHVKRFHSEEGITKSQTDRANAGPSERSKLACDQCRRAKIKCDNTHPCRLCRQKGRECTVSAASRRPGRPRTHESRQRPASSTVARVLVQSIYERPIAMTDDHQASILSDNAKIRGVNRPCLNPQSDELESQTLSEPVSANLDNAQNIGSVISSQQEINAITSNVTISPNIDMYLDGSMIICEDLVDMNFMDPIWDPIWHLPMDTPQWLKGIDHTDIDEQSPDFLESYQNGHSSLRPSPTESAVIMIAKYFTHRSGYSIQSRELIQRMSHTLQPQIYDKEVINILLRIGRSRICSTFSIFDNFEVSNQTSLQLCLSMAAIGALFSTEEGSEAVSMSLYSDARHLQMETYIRDGFDSFTTAANAAKTYLLLEIYGICSGNKRIYEFCEAFHYNTIEAFKACWQTAPSEADENTRVELAQLIESLQILDSFRVLLLSRPPCFLRWGHTSSKIASSRYPAEVLMDLEALAMPTLPLSRSMATAQNLATICSWTWMFSPRGQESTRPFQPWKTEFVELGLERWKWARAQCPSDTDFPLLLLYHLAYLNLYTNLPLLQRHAHEFLRSSEISGDVKSIAAIRVWLNGSHSPVAHWHAEAMISLITVSLGIFLPRQESTLENARALEPPHLPYCIYFATLVIWFYSIREGVHMDGTRSTPIDTAMLLLGKLRAPVAGVMSVALYNLRDQEGQ